MCFKLQPIISSKITQSTGEISRQNKKLHAGEAFAKEVGLT
jgi:hypothetical protein